MDKKILIISVLVGLLVAGAIGYFAYQGGYQLGFEQGKKIGASGGLEAYKGVSNPLEKMPSVNPFENVINPFKDLYKNPFK